MGVLVDDLLLLARLDHGRPPERQPVDLVDLAVDAVSDAHAAGPPWPVTLSAADPVVVQGDELRLRQLLANLLANGRQHTPPGTPIAVSVSGVGGEAVVSVVDDGPGLPPGPTTQVFDRFWRADPSRSHPDGRAGGNGLGLSIVRAIAEAHGGSVEAADEPGHGARFTVRLPFVAPTQPSGPLDPLDTPGKAVAGTADAARS
ncbi:HAMP domain-containing histidine kinase [Aquihabitans sp. G128]|uniref:sensor histidine kinase n=1 Tax=Aquihabitans sp. G128 TaxID=2849779 RepID=UPI001C249939|nr:HAMP domain-containing sensor histidine kinase [Aquihabitans sp. G128]QXC61776.1 HAMP domain-containing histidine kinase [Aquihabitans sp. G128]